jgi:hypothetical protein
MGQTIYLRRAGATKLDSDKLESVEVKGPSTLAFDFLGNAYNRPLITGETFFDLLPKASIDAGSDRYFAVTGTGTEVIARAAKGGVNLKSQASTPADGDNVFIAAVDDSCFELLINANTLGRFNARVALNTITAVFASFGLNENVTDVDPTGTAGEGAMFVFDPTGEFVTIANGFETDGSDNWVLAHKVNGVDTFTDTGVLVVEDQDYELEVAIGADLIPVFKINGIEVGTGPALTSGDSVRTFLGAELTATPGAQKDFDVRYVRLSREIG